MLTLELRGKDVTKGRLQCCTCTASLCGILGGRGRVAGPGGAGGNLKLESARSASGECVSGLERASCAAGKIVEEVLGCPRSS